MRADPQADREGVWCGGRKGPGSRVEGTEPQRQEVRFTFLRKCSKFLE